MRSTGSHARKFGAQILRISAQLPRRTATQESSGRASRREKKNTVLWPGWKPRAITYNGYYKEDCGACTGSCKTIDALTTSEVYGDNGETDASEPLSGVILTLVAA